MGSHSIPRLPNMEKCFLLAIHRLLLFLSQCHPTFPKSQDSLCEQQSIVLRAHSASLQSNPQGASLSKHSEVLVSPEMNSGRRLGCLETRLRRFSLFLSIWMSPMPFMGFIPLFPLLFKQLILQWTKTGSRSAGSFSSGLTLYPVLSHSYLWTWTHSTRWWTPMCCYPSIPLSFFLCPHLSAF